MVTTKYWEARNMLMAAALRMRAGEGQKRRHSGFADYFTRLLMAECAREKQLALCSKDSGEALQYIYLHILQRGREE